MARALGYRFGAGRSGGPAAISSVDAGVLHTSLHESRFTALCDVEHLLLGPQGAARVFGPQKGAGPDEVGRLEAGLEELVASVARWKGDEAAALADHAGSGAAGGLGFGVAAFLNATLLPGAETIAAMAGLARRVAACDLVVTGEGSLDRQTGGGKVVSRVLAETARARKPCVVVAGRWDGTLPAERPRSTRVMTGLDLEGSPGRLGADDLAAIGRIIGQKGRRG
jgi:glycerate kinase